MQGWITQIMNMYGYMGIFLLILIENIFPPIPSEVILTFGGFMTTYTTMTVPGVVIISTIGSTAGAMILYYAGSLLTCERLEKLLDGFVGKILHFKNEDISKAMDWFHHYGAATVFFCRCVPIVRSLISVPAGMTRMRMGRFLLFTILGSLIWNVALVGLGAVAGASWSAVAAFFHTYSYTFKLIGAAVIVVLLIIYYRKKMEKRRK